MEWKMLHTAYYLPNSAQIFRGMTAVESKGEGRSAFLLADIGGTQLRMALFYRGELFHQNTVNTENDPTIIGEIGKYASESGYTITRACIAMAGPVIEQKCSINNAHGATLYSAAEFSKRLGFPVKFLNDFEAVGYYICNSKNLTDNTWVMRAAGSNNVYDGVTMYLGPGTGLGIGFIDSHKVFACEAGHSLFSPQTSFDFELANFIRAKKQGKNVITEWVVSGRGIENLAEFLINRGDAPSGFVLPEKNVGKFISDKALSGDKFCQEILHKFYAYEGRFLHDVALSPRTSSIFIAGGITASHKELFELRPDIKKDFSAAFLGDDESVHSVLTNIPIRGFADDNTGLFGCAIAAEHME